jgi:hypothetical protein
MKVRLTLCAMAVFLAASAAAVSAEGSQKYLGSLDGVSSYYRPFAEQVAKQGFFREPIYAQLRTALAANKKFVAEVMRYYPSPDEYFQRFHDYTLAYSCYTFQLAMGSKFPDEYYAELEVAGKKLKEASQRTDITAAQKATLEEKISSVRLLQKRIREYQAALPKVSKALLSEVAAHASEMDSLYQRLFTPR